MGRTKLTNEGQTKQRPAGKGKTNVLTNHIGEN